MTDSLCCGCCCSDSVKIINKNLQRSTSSDTGPHWHGSQCDNSRGSHSNVPEVDPITLSRIAWRLLNLRVLLKRCMGLLGMLSNDNLVNPQRAVHGNGTGIHMVLQEIMDGDNMPSTKTVQCLHSRETIRQSMPVTLTITILKLWRYTSIRNVIFMKTWYQFQQRPRLVLLYDLYALFQAS